jgi:uncharacterized membrane protein (GlpM family)
MEWVLRFLLGGLLVCAFATLGDILKPRGFAGLFGAAPSVAVASLTISALSQGPVTAARSSQAMVLGAIALLVYANLCLYLMGSRHLKAPPVTVLALPVWLGVAIGLWALWLR